MPEGIDGHLHGTILYMFYTYVSPDTPIHIVVVCVPRYQVITHMGRYDVSISVCLCLMTCVCVRISFSKYCRASSFQFKHIACDCEHTFALIANNNMYHDGYSMFEFKRVEHVC